MKRVPWGPEWTRRSVIMPEDAIPWNVPWARVTATQNQETAPVYHERVPNGVNGLRIAQVYVVQDNSANARHTCTINLRLGDLRTVSPIAGQNLPGYLTTRIAVQHPLFFPVYWVIPSGYEFDISLLQNFVAAPLMFGYASGWYF